MLELRKDYILDRWVISASVRDQRPKQFKITHEKVEPKLCVFCPENINLTPSETGRVEKNGKWILRWFANKFPFVEQKGNPKLRKTGKFLVNSAGYGDHEVIVDTNSHDKQLWDKDKNHISELLKVIAKRITEMEKVKCIKYVLAFKNHGEKAGTSILHSHVQLASVAMIPTEIKTKIAAVNEHKRCPYCEIIKIESKSKRKCFENKDFVAFAPYASRFNYEIWFFPKRHVTRMENLKESEISSLAELIHKTLTKLKSINASYNLFIQYSPGKEDLHFHIEITPRIATWAGFEFSSGIVINSVSPESAAGFYRS